MRSPRKRSRCPWLDPPAAGAAHEDQAPARAHPAHGAAGHLEIQPDVIAESVAHLAGVHLEQRAVARSACGHHHMVNWFGQATEEPLQRRPVVRIEGGDALGAHLRRRLLEPIRIAAGENDFGTL